MQKILRILALAALVGTLGVWIGTGASRGWTKTSRPVKTVDEVTGIEAIAYQKQFSPGVDFLAAGGLGAGILAGAAWIFKPRKKQE